MPAPKNQRARIRLPQEHIEKLTTMSEDIALAREELETLRKLGMDTSDIEDKLNWAEAARETLLKKFGS